MAINRIASAIADDRGLRGLMASKLTGEARGGRGQPVASMVQTRRGWGSRTGGVTAFRAAALHPDVTEAAAAQLANAECYRYALKYKPGQQKC